MTDFILDASVAAAWLLPDEDSTIATTAFARLASGKAIVPPIWHDEARNILLVCERRGRLTAMQSDEALALLAQLPIEVRHVSRGGDIMALCRRHQLSAYDGIYLALAISEKLPLASLDKLLCAAAASENVTLVGI